MEYFAELESAVLDFCVKEYHMDCLCAKSLIKIEKESGKILFEKEICTLSVLNQDNYELVGKWKIGEDLSSDICGMAVDEKTIFCSIRNGKLITVDRYSFEQKEYSVHDSSMWSLKIYGYWLLCGTVGGQLLLLDRESIVIRKRLILGKKNIRSLFIDGEILYAASQDKKLFKIDLVKFVVIAMQKNIHKKMFDCAGLYEDMLVTVSYPCSEIILWNKNTLEKIKEINVPLKLSGNTYIEENKLYICSRNIYGIMTLGPKDMLLPTDAADCCITTP